MYEQHSKESCVFGTFFLLRSLTAAQLCLTTLEFRASLVTWQHLKQSYGICGFFSPKTGFTLIYTTVLFQIE
jgi:hypothetical protein